MTAEPAGYSGTPLPRKLGIKPAARLAILRPPDGFDATLGELTPEVYRLSRTVPPLDVILYFTRRRADLLRRLPRLTGALGPAGGLWVAWPKKTSGVATDRRFEAVQTIGLAAGLVDNKVCAIDSTWSALRFVYRVQDR